MTTMDYLINTKALKAAIKAAATKNGEAVFAAIEPAAGIPGVDDDHVMVVTNARWMVVLPGDRSSLAVAAHELGIPPTIADGAIRLDGRTWSLCHIAPNLRRPIPSPETLASADPVDVTSLRMETSGPTLAVATCRRADSDGGAYALAFFNTAYLSIFDGCQAVSCASVDGERRDVERGLLSSVVVMLSRYGGLVGLVMPYSAPHDEIMDALLRGFGVAVDDAVDDADD